MLKEANQGCRSMYMHMRETIQKLPGKLERKQKEVLGMWNIII